MKTAVLNATDQPTRSVRTAKMSPMAVTSAGTTSTQIALFLTAVKDVAGEDLLVVVEPDELVARAAEAALERVDGRIDDPEPEEEDRRRKEARGDRVASPVATARGGAPVPRAPP